MVAGMNANPEGKSFRVQALKSVGIFDIAKKAESGVPDSNRINFIEREISIKWERHEVGLLAFAGNQLCGQNSRIGECGAFREVTTEKQFASYFLDDAGSLADIHKGPIYFWEWHLGTQWIDGVRSIGEQTGRIEHPRINVGPIPAKDGLNRSAEMTALPCANKDQQESEGGQKAIGNFDSVAMQDRPEFCTVIANIFCVASGFFSQIIGWRNWYSGSDVLSGLYLFTGFGLAIFGIIGLLIGDWFWNIWRLL